MSEGIVISSTTNSEEQVRAAAGLPPEQLSLENGDHSEETDIRTARAENGNGKVTPKADKYIKKLTARAKAAEEEVAALRAQLTADGKYMPPTLDKRIDKLTAQKHALARERDELKSRLNGTEQAADRPETWHGNSREIERGVIETSNQRDPEVERQTAPADHEEPVDPKLEFVRNREAQWAEEHHRKAIELNQRIESDPTKKEKFSQAVEKAKGYGIPLSKIVLHSFVDLPNGEDAAVYILSNPKIYESIHRMTPQEQLKEVHRISAGLEFNPPDRKPTLPVSSAPPPIKPLSGHSTNGHRINLADDNLDYQTYRREREKEAPQRRQKGYGI